MKRFLLIGLGAIALFACGGKVVFEQPLASGAGGAPVSTSVGTTNGAGGRGSSCAELIGAYEAAYSAAISCDANANDNACMSDNRVPDNCGCPHPANIDGVFTSQAIGSYDAMIAAGCMANTQPCSNGCDVAPPGDMFLQCIQGVCGQGPG